MKKVCIILLALMVALTSVSFAGDPRERVPFDKNEPIPQWGQDKIPSFFEMDEYNHRYPTDTDVRMYMNHWKDSHITAEHGGFIERAYFTPGDPTNPPAKAAVLKYITAYNHGMLERGCETQPTTHEKAQVFFFVLAGKGRVEAGGKSEDITDGHGIFIPQGLEYKFINTDNDKALEVVIIEEETYDGFEPLTEMKVGTYKTHMPRPGMHWAHIGRGIVDGVKFANPMGLAVVSIDAFDIAQPHVHGLGCEEIWNQIKGDSLLLFGNRLYKMPSGTAFYAVPNLCAPHCSINHTDEPMQWLYLGNRHDDPRIREISGHHDGWNWE